MVVDNASSDESLKTLKENFPRVTLIENKENVGFAKANNQAILKSKGEYILLLNTDARVNDRAIEKSIEDFKKDKSLGVVGGKLVYEDRTLQKSAGFFPTLISVFNWMFFVDDIPLLNHFLKPYHVENSGFYKKSQNVDWVSGAYFMARKEVVDKIGLLDESLFMYGEEVEWCFRIKWAGYEVKLDPSIQIIHDKGGSSRIGKDAGIIEEFKFILYFYRKYKPRWQQKTVQLLLQAGIKLRSILFGIIPKHKSRKELYDKAFEVAG